MNTVQEIEKTDMPVTKEKRSPGKPGHGIKKIKAERKRSRQARKANRKRR